MMNFRVSRDRRAVALMVSCVTFALSSQARADDPPSARSAGSFEAARGTPSSEHDDLRFRLQLGFTGAMGNTRSFGLNAATRFVIRRGIHQFSVDGAANFGLNWNLPAMLPAMIPPGGVDALRTQTIAAQQMLARARYDVFLTENNALYVAPQAFHDFPAGFNSRISGQFGYARNFVNQPDRRRFWGEIGMDLTYENTTQPGVPGQMAVPGVTSYDRFMPQARLFVGFEEKSNRAFEFSIGVEPLLDLSRPSNFRMNSTMAIASRISDWFSIGLQATLRFVNEPVPLRADPVPANVIARDPFDLTTLLTLVFNFAPAPPTPPPAPACPPCQACAPCQETPAGGNESGGASGNGASTPPSAQGSQPDASAAAGTPTSAGTPAPAPAPTSTPTPAPTLRRQ